MTLQEIKTAVANNTPVYFKEKRYTVVPDSNGVLQIKYQYSERFEKPLLNANGELSENEFDFYIDDISLYRVNNDINGNPRYVTDYFNFLNKDDKSTNVLNQYDIAAKKANKIGGSKYRGKDFGGGIVFQCYNQSDLKRQIREVQAKVYKK